MVSRTHTSSAPIIRISRVVATRSASSPNGSTSCRRIMRKSSSSTTPSSCSRTCEVRAMAYNSYDTILFEKRDRVATVTLNRPERLNAVSEEMTDELLDVFTEIEQDAEVWTIIVT